MPLFFQGRGKEKDTQRVGAIVVAAGSSARMGGENKLLALIGGIPVLAHTLQALEDCPSVEGIYVVTREPDILLVSDIAREYEISKVRAVIAGGDSRQESVRIGLDAAAEYDLVAVHDGARPFACPDEIEAAIDGARLFGAAAPGAAVHDTLKAVSEEGFITRTIDRQQTRRILTPQVFRRELLALCHSKARESGVFATDDCALVEQFGTKVFVTEGSAFNMKITTKEDLLLAQALYHILEDDR